MRMYVNTKLHLHGIVTGVPNQCYKLESGSESLALKIAFGEFFRLRLFFIVFYSSNSIRCEISMLVSNYARSFLIQTGL